MKTYIALAVAVLALVFSVTGGKTTVEKLGSIAGPDIPSPYLAWGGEARYNARASLTQATTTVCALQSPAATSTLLFATANFSNASSTAILVTLAKASTQYATTTRISSATISNPTGTVIATSTLDATGGNTIFAPNQWMVVGVAQGISTGDAAGTGFIPSGDCAASWYVN